jgi:hypothetical protein
MKSLNFYATTLSIAILACGSVEVAPDSGTVNTTFGQYVALGSGLTAGFTQGGLFRDGQSNSFPSLLAKQLKEVGAADFKQPLFEVNQANGTGFLNAKSINPQVPYFLQNFQG